MNGVYDIKFMNSDGAMNITSDVSCLYQRMVDFFFFLNFILQQTSNLYVARIIVRHHMFCVQNSFHILYLKSKKKLFSRSNSCVVENNT